MVVIPRSGGRRSLSGSFELLSWYFFRVSGLLLIGLILGHIATVHLVTPIDQVDFAFVQDRYATPFWRIYDWLMLTLALFHGINGLRVATDDYLRRRGWRVAVVASLAVLALVFFLVGTYNIIAFD
jgi:succinate dehydrogenase / fumarate reductase, membrane anchor subunit